MKQPLLRIITLATAACLLLPAALAAEGEVLKVETGDSVLDRNGDGFQDVIVNRKRVHFDVDFDGRFDYTLSLHLSEYATEDHREYLASGRDPGVFRAITATCLDALCATDRDKAKWYENNFGTFTYYDGWYTSLYLFSDSPLNDGRLASKKHRGEYEYWVTFNPDGTIKTLKKGDRSLSLAEFDYQAKTSSGQKVTLPKIGSREDLERVRARLSGLF